MKRHQRPPWAFALLVACVTFGGCKSAPSEPEPPTERQPEPAAATQTQRGYTERAAPTPTPSPAAPPKLAAKPVAEVPPSPDDPLKGKFALADATKGMAGKGALVAELKTAQGKLECELYEDRAPITVANFVGVARGLRPFKDPDGKWVKRPGYDGTTFHRIIKGFMIQGGDPSGTGAGGPGYVIPDEVWEGAAHDQRGLICMANRGPNTNGMQFFILDGAAPHLDGGYTIFGKCEPASVVEQLAGVATRGERPIEPPRIEKVTIKRR